MSQWVGASVSVFCGDSLGTYQGKVLEVTSASLTLTKVYRNGLPLPRDTVTLKSCDIQDLKIIDLESSKDDVVKKDTRDSVTVAKPIARKAKATNNNEYSLHPSGNSNLSSPQCSNFKSNCNNGSDFVRHPRTLPQSSTNTAGTGQTNEFIQPFNNTRALKLSRKDEACFGGQLSERTYTKDFDFEKNLALFDKQRVWEQLNNLQKPDILKQTTNEKSKLRHDENVISTLPTVFREIVVLNSPVNCAEYVTDSGLIVPGISLSMRKELWLTCEKYQYSWEKRCELMGRNITEMTLQLLGGSYRLNPYNTHQAPTVLCICGPNHQGAMALNAARQLTTQGVNVVVYLADDQSLPRIVQAELNFFLLTRNKTVLSLSSLPSVNSIDLVILGLFNEQTDLDSYPLISNWLSQHRVPTLAIDPPPDGLRDIEVKMSLIPALPLRYCYDVGKLYLCNIGIPVQIFNEIGIKYKSPFNSKFVIPLHPK